MACTPGSDRAGWCNGGWRWRLTFFAIPARQELWGARSKAWGVGQDEGPVSASHPTLRHETISIGSPGADFVRQGHGLSGEGRRDLCRPLACIKWEKAGGTWAERMRSDGRSKRRCAQILRTSTRVPSSLAPPCRCTWLRAGGPRSATPVGSHTPKLNNVSHLSRFSDFGCGGGEERHSGSPPSGANAGGERDGTGALSARYRYRGAPPSETSAASAKRPGVSRTAQARGGRGTRSARGSRRRDPKRSNPPGRTLLLPQPSCVCLLSPHISTLISTLSLPPSLHTLASLHPPFASLNPSLPVPFVPHPGLLIVPPFRDKTPGHPSRIISRKVDSPPNSPSFEEILLSPPFPP